MACCGGSGARCGGAAELGRRRPAEAGVAVVVEKRRGGPFYMTSKAVGRWNAAVAAGERRGVPLMVLRLLAAIVEWRTGGEAGTG